MISHMDIKNLKINLEALISNCKKAIIIPHINADFDAIGAAAGLADYIKKYDKDGFILVNDQPHTIDPGVKAIIDELKNDFSIITKDKYKSISSKHDVYILVDVNKSYLIPIGEMLNYPDSTMIIDHHTEDMNTVPSNYKYIDTTVSSAAEIITKLYQTSRTKIPSNIANYLLAGIYLDTIRLTKNLTPETLKAVAKLLEYGANMNVVTDYFSEDFLSDRRVQELVSKANIMTLDIATIIAPEGEIYTKEELAKAADYALKYKVDASFAIGNTASNEVSISARSKERIDVGMIMAELGGGGHKYSGATRLENVSINDVNESLQKVLKPRYYL